MKTPPLLSVALLASLLVASAQETHDHAAQRREIQTALERLWSDNQDRYLAMAGLPAEDAPSTDETLQHICPVHRVPMWEFVAGKRLRGTSRDEPVVVVGQTLAHVCPTGGECYLRIESEGQAPVWRGPITDEGLPRPRPIERPRPEVDTGPARPDVTRATIEGLLRLHRTQDGDPGFYEGRFDEMKRLGPRVVTHLITIVGDTDDAQVKHLAIEALKEVGDERAIPALRDICKDSGQRAYHMQAGVALHALGDSSVIDAELAARKEAINDIRRSSRERAVIHGQMGLILSLIDNEGEAISHYRDAIRLDPSNEIAHYNLACSFAKRGLVDEAVGALEDALRVGYEDWEWLMIDGDLAQVRKTQAFRDLQLRYHR